MKYNNISRLFWSAKRRKKKSKSFCRKNTNPSWVFLERKSDWVGFICTMGFKLWGDEWDCLIVRLQGQKEALAPSSSCLVRGLKPFSKTQPFISPTQTQKEAFTDAGWHDSSMEMSTEYSRMVSKPRQSYCC